MIALLLAWGALMLLLAVECVAAVSHAGRVAFAVAPVMVMAVAFSFMHAARAPALARIFACAGLLWLSILLILGNVDFLARVEEPVPAAPSAGIAPIAPASGAAR